MSPLHDAGVAWMTVTHPDWVEHQIAMLARWQGMPSVWSGWTADPETVLDDLYHLVTNTPGCAFVISPS